MENTSFDIIVLAWQKVDYLLNLLISLEDNSFFSHNIYLWLNECNKKEHEKLSNFLDFRTKYSDHKIEVFESEQNLGIPFPVNTCASFGSNDFVYLIDDDMYVGPDWDIELVDFYNKHNLDKENFFLSSTMVEYNPGSNHSIHRFFGSGLENFALHKFEKFCNHLIDRDQGYYSLPPTISTFQPVLIPRSLWEKAGGYSEEFAPAIGTDDDLAKKCWDLGCTDMTTVPCSLVYHFQSKSTNKIDRSFGAQNRDKLFIEKYGISIKEFHSEIKRETLWEPKISI